MILKNLSKMNLKNANVLILGKGYIGNYIFDHLSSSGYTNVTCASSKDLNYHDRRTFWKYLVANEPNVVINCSGFTGRPNIDQAELKKDECWNLNVYSPLQTAELCNKLGIKYMHISSGCIFDGYEKEFTEEDTPNFGLYDTSSFYSKTKHAFEVMSKHLPIKILRIRMPFSPDLSNRNYLTKIKNYDNLINYKNSKTYIPDLCSFIDALLRKEDLEWIEQDIYNIVNKNPLHTSELIEVLKHYGFENPNWKLVDMKDIPIVAPRSNCVLNGSKVDQIFEMKTEKQALKEALQ